MTQDIRPVHRVRYIQRAVLLVMALACGPAVGRAWAQPGAPLSVPPPGKLATDRLPILKDVGLDQHLGAQLPLDLPFVDELGRDVKLGDFFGKRPVVLALVYYQCPMLCTLVLNGLTSSMDELTFDAGKDFDVVAVSFDPGETPSLAESKKEMYLKRYGRPGGNEGVHFLTGRESSIRALTSAVGFKYAYDPQIAQFAHPALITVVTPRGQVSRYLLGIDYGARDLRLALVEASENKIGTFVDQALLYCYHYDPVSGKYGLVILNFVRLGGILTVGGLGMFIFMALRRDRRQAVSAGAGRPTLTGTR